MFPLTPLLLIPFLQRGRWALSGCAVGIILFAPVPWWNVNPISLPPWQWAFFGILGVFVIVTVRAALNRFNIAHTRPRRSYYIAAFGIAVVFALGLGMYSAALTQYFPAYIAWHHWGAYLSPVEALRAGGIPFRDFPIQYGIGPTLLITAVCNANCWNAMFHIVLVANALYCGALVVCALILTAEHSRLLRAISAVAMAAAAILWTAFPSDFGTALETPSVAGLRFLPLICQLMFILCAENNARLPRSIGHGIWAFNLFWSIEAAAFASLLWWSWLALGGMHAQNGNGRFAFVLRHVVKAAAATFGGIVVLLGAFWLAFGALPELSSMIAYLQNPPGALPPNFAGPVWLAFLFAIMAIIKLLRERHIQNGSLFACVVTMTVAFSYYLSRAHDNNVLILFPLILLVALSLLPTLSEQKEPENQFCLGFCLTFVMSVIIFISTFNFWVWEKVISSGNLAQTGSAPLIRQISSDGNFGEPIISSDAAYLIGEARKTSDTTPLLFDRSALLPFAMHTRGWTGVNNIANYSPLPPELVGLYIQRGAARYNRAGWIIVEREKYDGWVHLFAQSYQISIAKQRGRYAAYLMVPKKLATVPQRRRNGVDR